MDDANNPQFEQMLRRIVAEAVREALLSARKNSAEAPKSILRIDEVAQRTGLSESTVRNRVAPESLWFDPQFPKAVDLGNSADVRVAFGWRSTDIDEWIDTRPKHKVSHQVNNKFVAQNPGRMGRAARASAKAPNE